MRSPMPANMVVPPEEIALLFALHDGLECRVMNIRGLLANEAWLEKHLRATETLTDAGKHGGSTRH